MSQTIELSIHTHAGWCVDSAQELGLGLGKSVTRAPPSQLGSVEAAGSREALQLVQANVVELFRVPFHSCVPSLPGGMTLRQERTRDVTSPWMP